MVGCALVDFGWFWRERGLCFGGLGWFGVVLAGVSVFCGFVIIQISFLGCGFGLCGGGL